MIDNHRAALDMGAIHDFNKPYALHAPEVDLHRQGRGAAPFEFVVKVSMAVTHKSGLVVGARSFPGNPDDGHTLAGQIEQNDTGSQHIGVKSATAAWTRYTAMSIIVPVNIIHCGQYKTRPIISGAG